MKQNKQPSGHPAKKLPVWALVVIDVLATCLALGLFMLFQLVLPRIREQRALENREAELTVMSDFADLPSPSPAEAEEQPVAGQEAEVATEPTDDWKFAYLTSDEVVVTENTYSSHDIYVSIRSYDEDEGVIKSAYTVADIYVRDVRCLQSYFAGGKYIPTGHGSPILNLMEESGAIVAANGDYYSMQVGSGVLRNGVLYRCPVNRYDVCVLYDDGTVTIFRDTIKTSSDWKKAFEHAWQVWCFGPSLLDENGEPYPDLRKNIFSVMAERNPRTGFGYFEPGHYCLVVVDGRSDIAPGANIEELASVFADLGCKQAYNLDGGGSSVMAFDGEVITNQSVGRKLPDIILVTEYEGSVAQRELETHEEEAP